ncbi:MAG: hypothetical protein DRO88_01510 [Promethearchaeia archaeon]|nr:MAG: hypothetical protein DRO88_01510 [Candidatus Lokiarchaeia archaeon]
MPGSITIFCDLVFTTHAMLRAPKDSAAIHFISTKFHRFYLIMLTFFFEDLYVVPKMSNSSYPEFTVNLYGPFYSLTRKKKVTFTNDHQLPTVKEMLQKVVSIYPKLEEYIFEDDHLAEFTTIVINGDLISEEEWEKVRIHPEDRISLFKGQHGG